MKKNTYGMGLLAAFAMVFNAQAADGNVNIIGNVVAQTCKVSSESANMTVPLGDIQRAELNTPGAKTTSIPFTLNFTDCNAYTNLWVAFEGTAAANDSSVFALDKQGQEGTANGVGLEIYTYEWDPFRPNQSNYVDSMSPMYSSVKLFARYKALNSDIKPGTANVTLQYSVTYW